LHNGASVDGRVDGFLGDIGLFYQVASAFGAGAMLAGSDTLLAAYASAPPDGETATEPAPSDGEPGGLLAVPDSRGRIGNWPQIRREPWWRDVVVLCARATPRAYVAGLEEIGLDYIVAGEARVDLRAALEALHARYGVEVVQVDSGGTLNGALLRAGLVDEVSLLISPTLAGGTSPNSIYRAPDLDGPEGILPLRLRHLERLAGDVVWLRYELVHGETEG
jgi:2,5-diamino-6-(ribosylamino)-4(3H)-pyrimidinone 5'-phosphate reductase